MLSQGLPGKDDLKALDRADAVILPQGCRKELYMLAREHCCYVFPNYGVRFQYPGKTGQSRLFSELMTPSPEQIVLEEDTAYSAGSLPFSYPFVIKGAWGGAGNNVILVKNKEEFEASRGKIYAWIKNGGCLAQEYVPAGGKSLRVVVIGRKFYSYWRINQQGGFYSNLSKGAVVCNNSFKNLENKAIDELRLFCRATGINLAGFDFLFSVEENDPRPLLLEINYCFGTRGLGGPDLFLGLLEKGIREWLAELF
ncbi:MAG: ATP-grasp domain-containing protein [Thermodesulfobacteriota bacterium]